MPSELEGDTNPEYELKKIKNSRTQIKGELTRFQTFLNSFDLTSTNAIESLQIRFENIKSILSRFQDIQTQFDELIMSDFPDDFNEDESNHEREIFETRYYESLATAQKTLDDYSSRVRQTEALASSTAASSSGGAIRGAGGGIYAQQSQHYNHTALPSVASHLQPVKIPTFTGSYSEWQRFSDLFKAIVHDNRNIPDVSKFFYLEGALQGEPKKIIASLPATDANYTIAWDLLQKRYENKKIIINAHIKDIMEIPSLSRESHTMLRSLSNTFFKSYHSLGSLGENVKEWKTILIYILVSKLDNSSKREWEIYCKEISSPSIGDFENFLSQRCQILETLDVKSFPSTSNKRDHESKSFVTNNTNNAYEPKCPHCKERHFIYFCEKFKQLSVTDRMTQAKILNLCTNCLRYGHRNVVCRSSGCKICKQRHATLLHRESPNQNPNQNSNHHESSRNVPDMQNSDNKMSSAHVVKIDNSNIKNEQEGVPPSLFASSTCLYAKDSFIVLATAIVHVLDKDQNLVPCKVLLDSGSQSNFVTSSMVEKLKLRSSKFNLPVIGINQIKTNITERIELNIYSQHTKFKTILKFLILPSIAGLMPQTCFDASKLNIPSDLPLADYEFNTPSEIDMLVGSEVFFELICNEQIKLGKNLPILQKTLLGWVISGPIPYGKSKGKSDVMFSNCNFSQNNLKESLEKFWLVEEINHEPRALMSKEEIECEEYFSKTTIRDDTGKFIVKFPLKDNYHDLGESEQTALNRFYAIERRLNKNPEIENSYKNFMSEYENLGHMTEILHDLPSETPIYYIPHHCVEKPESTTTKLRVVFDAACKTSTNLSLNSVLKIGPTIQNDLFSILIRFRKHTFVLVGDLTKMYRQVWIDKEERNLQRILWRSSQKEKIKHFQLNTVTYGTASASFLSTRCLVQIAIDNLEKWPAESNIIRSDFYVDDLLTGTTNFENLLKLKSNICQILSNYGFELRKLQSNEPKLLENINNQSHENSKYLISDDSTIKTLGVSWIPKLDKFEYNSQTISTKSETISKRSILSFVAKIFDPLGILGPLSVRAKLIIQKLWKLDIDWDDQVPSNLISEWTNLKNEISQVGLMQVPRHVLVKNPNTIEIHGFCDASELAYACCIYLRSADADGHIESHLLCAKSRVSPLKCQSLPRLELLGAFILSKLIVKCKEALKIENLNTFLWTDSTIVLCWIASEPKTLKTFVANRVAKIQNNTRTSDWNYIVSEQNPADIISRGMFLRDLINSDLWLHGPKFFIEQHNWPQNSNIKHFAKRKLDEIPEIRSFMVQEKVRNSETQKENKDKDKDEITNFENVCIFERYSSFTKLIRVVAYCLRFLQIPKIATQQRQTGKLTITELENSELTLARLAQREHFSAEIHRLKNKKCVHHESKLRSYSPFLDDQGIIRLGGRIKNANYSFDVKHPIVLHPKHNYTNLVIDFHHKRTLHLGTQGTLSHIRQKYWPIHGKQAVRSYIHKCIKCFRANPNETSHPKMGDLPRTRLTPSRPFLSSAVDYAGPFELKPSKLRTNKLIKGYICIFVCLVTKAVHIELITDLTSDGFLSLLKRFVSRRGFCTDVYSDNASNFVGSNNELISIQNLIEHDEFQNYLSHSKIKWHFMPARSPHFGGLHEAAVKSCKHHLKRVLNNIHLHYEEFYTLLTQIEAILNSRPLVPISSDPNDLEPITPAHFLIGEQLTAIPERNLVESKIPFTKRYQHLQQMGQHFWSRWRLEYLAQLQSRNKWQFDVNENFHVGSMVLLKEDNVPPMCWPLGRVVAVHPGKDNVIRVVSIKTKGSIVKRAVNRVALLPLV